MLLVCTPTAYESAMVRRALKRDLVQSNVLYGSLTLVKFGHLVVECLAKILFHGVKKNAFIILRKRLAVWMAADEILTTRIWHSSESMYKICLGVAILPPNFFSMNTKR